MLHPIFLEEDMKASKPSIILILIKYIIDHPPNQGGKLSKRLGGIYLNYGAQW